MTKRHSNPGRPKRPARWLGLWVLIAVLQPIGVFAQVQGQAARGPSAGLMFEPVVVRMPGEGWVVDRAQLRAVCDSPGQAAVLGRWLAERGAAVIDADRPGLVLHYYADGIEAMTRADLLWEGLPQRMATMQSLIDHAITRSRATGRPIGHLIVTGHAGLPGCAAWGGTLDDCTFRGALTDYQRGQLRRLRPYLARDAEIEIRQCGSGGGQPGRDLLTAVHRATGAAGVSYTNDFYFGTSATHPRVVVDEDGWRVVAPAH